MRADHFTAGGPFGISRSNHCLCQYSKIFSNFISTWILTFQKCTKCMNIFHYLNFISHSRAFGIMVHKSDSKKKKQQSYKWYEKSMTERKRKTDSMDLNKITHSYTSIFQSRSIISEWFFFSLPFYLFSFFPHSVLSSLLLFLRGNNNNEKILCFMWWQVKVHNVFITHTHGFLSYY